ncbi:hypothetical protein KDJ56_00880 [Brevibacillus composti]|uniref:Uncharacterized protein n=1 Tax=Brevibacillus composti TaxID=2796470 RepID=A0A7T5JP13_9BACL|nr:hypothetical protein [Brevibacillus composti]QQE74595.1 hypothetical protein JD108_00880 [Brevibacillus composti]QUO41678.1 hypothetical protein KDJ56_00880 [Brevibacillus composti]
MKKIALFSLVAGLLFSSFPNYSKAFDNDLNNDGYVDAMYIDSYEGFAYDSTRRLFSVGTTSKGERASVLVAYAITPHWNQQPTGVEYVRSFTDTLGVQREYGAVPGTVYPEYIRNQFVIPEGDAYAHIYRISPRNQLSEVSLGSLTGLMELIGLERASFLLDTVFSIVTEVESLSTSSPNSSGDYGSSAYVTQWFTSYSSWKNNTNGNTDLPSTISSSNAYKDRSRGFFSEFKYQDDAWSRGSKHRVEAITRIKYVMKLQSSGLTYSFNHLNTLNHYSYGY